MRFLISKASGFSIAREDDPPCSKAVICEAPVVVHSAAYDPVTGEHLAQERTYYGKR